MVMAREYEKLTAELHEQARENLHLRSGMATTEHALTSLRSRLQITQNEEVMAVNEARQAAQMASDNVASIMNDAQGDRLATQRETNGLPERLGEEEEFRAMAVQRMQEAENQLRHYEDNAKQNLPTMHEELNELRKALRNQEELHARTTSELEASRLLPQQGSQQISSMPISSRTWGCIGKGSIFSTRN